MKIRKKNISMKWFKVLFFEAATLLMTLFVFSYPGIENENSPVRRL